MREIARSEVARVWTKLPVKVTKIDLVKQTVELQPTVMGREQVRDDQGQLTWKDVQMPLLVDVPIKFPQGGGYTMTFPIKEGDEGTVAFSSRSIDNWWADGGIQPQVTSNGRGSYRRHSLSDGFFEMGGRSQPNKLNNVSADNVQLRSDDGNTVVEMSASGIELKHGGGTLSFANGNLSVTGQITAFAGTGNSVSLANHTHAQPNDSHADTEMETIKPTAGT